MESKWTGHRCLALVYNQVVSAILGILLLRADMNVFSNSGAELKETCQNAALAHVVYDCRLTGGENVDHLSVSVKDPSAILKCFLSEIKLCILSCDV